MSKRKKRVVILGGGIAAHLLDFVLATRKDVEVVMVAANLLPNAMAGLRYIHVPEGPYFRKWIKNNFGEGTLSPIKIDWAIKGESGKFIFDSRKEKQLLRTGRQNVVNDYCEANFRPYQKDAMNNYAKNPVPQKAIALTQERLMSFLSSSRKAEVLLDNVVFIDPAAKAIRLECEAYRDVQYDVLVNTMPLPVISSILGIKKKFNYNSAAYLTAATSIELYSLSYYYNLDRQWESGYCDFSPTMHLARVVDQGVVTCFEFSFVKGCKIEDVKLSRAGAIQEAIRHVCEISPEKIHFQEVSYDVNMCAHITPDEKSVDALCAVSNLGIYSIGRYATWEPRCMTEDMFNSAVSIAEMV
jgi:hypothetical protein